MSTTTTTPTETATGLVAGLYAEGEPIKDTKAPAGPIQDRWTKHKFDTRLVTSDLHQLTIQNEQLLFDLIQLPKFAVEHETIGHRQVERFEPGSSHL